MKKLIKNNVFLILIFFFLFVITSIYSCVAKSASNFNGITIVLDAGHGGRDGGSTGTNGTVEKEINLQYTLSLKEKLVKYGYRVILTRKNDDGLYSNLAHNKKVDDMNKRMEIIKQANPNLVLSIHMNSFPDKSVKGANTFYKTDDESSRNCANLIQNCLKNTCNAKNSMAKPGDYFMMNCSYYTSVLVECGFLSNEEDEYKLNTEEYKNQIVEAIFNGILLYFGNVQANV